MALRPVEEIPYPPAPKPTDDADEHQRKRLRALLRRWYNDNPERFVYEVSLVLAESGLLDDEPDVRHKPLLDGTLYPEFVETTEEFGVDEGTRTPDNRNHNSVLSAEDTKIYANIVQRYKATKPDLYVGINGFSLDKNK